MQKVDGRRGGQNVRKETKVAPRHSAAVAPAGGRTCGQSHLPFLPLSSDVSMNALLERTMLWGYQVPTYL